MFPRSYSLEWPFPLILKQNGSFLHLTFCRKFSDSNSSWRERFYPTVPPLIPAPARFSSQPPSKVLWLLPLSPFWLIHGTVPSSLILQNTVNSWPVSGTDLTKGSGMMERTTSQNRQHCKHEYWITEFYGHPTPESFPLPIFLHELCWLPCCTDSSHILWRLLSCLLWILDNSHTMKNLSCFKKKRFTYF